MPSGVDFSIPATNGTSGHASTQTSLFLHVPSSPSADTTIFDYNLGSGYYYRLRLSGARHLVLEFSLTGYGSASADLGVLAVNTWTWVSCGFSTAGGLHIRGDATPYGGATATTSALASSGSATGTTQVSVPFGLGVSMTSSYLAFPDNEGAGWLGSKLIQNQIAADAAAGNPEPMPSTDFAPSADYREYLAHDPLGAASVLTDSGTAGIDLFAGSQGLTIVDDGPPLLPSSPGPGGAHEGDLSIYQGGQWVTLHVGTDGQELTVSSGYPSWTDEPIATTSTTGAVKVGSGLSVTGDGTISVTGGSGGVGSVTSIDVAAPTGLTSSGGPITSSGVITLAWATQSANRVLAGPTTGSAAAPTFRTLVPADVGLAAEGALLYQHSGALSALAVGASGLALMSDGVDPHYADPVAGAPTRWEPVTTCDGSCLVSSSCDPIMALVSV